MLTWQSGQLQGVPGGGGTRILWDGPTNSPFLYKPSGSNGNSHVDGFSLMADSYLYPPTYGIEYDTLFDWADSLTNVTISGASLASLYLKGGFVNAHIFGHDRFDEFCGYAVLASVSSLNQASFSLHDFTVDTGSLVHNQPTHCGVSGIVGFDNSSGAGSVYFGTVSIADARIENQASSYWQINSLQATPAIVQFISGNNYAGSGTYNEKIPFVSLRNLDVQFLSSALLPSGTANIAWMSTDDNGGSVSPGTTVACPLFELRNGKASASVNSLFTSPHGNWCNGAAIQQPSPASSQWPNFGISAAFTHCISSASPAVCGEDAQGYVMIGAGSSTVMVDTNAVTADSTIIVRFDESLGTALGVTCNSSSASEGATYFASARTAGTSFTIKTNTAPTTNPACLSYVIFN